jgi:hypothetical protein
VWPKNGKWKMKNDMWKMKGFYPTSRFPSAITIEAPISHQNSIATSASP